MTTYHCSQDIKSEPWPRKMLKSVEYHFSPLWYLYLASISSCALQKMYYNINSIQLDSPKLLLFFPHMLGSTEGCKAKLVSLWSWIMYLWTVQNWKPHFWNQSAEIFLSDLEIRQGTDFGNPVGREKYCYDFCHQREKGRFYLLPDCLWCYHL